MLTSGCKSFSCNNKQHKGKELFNSIWPHSKPAWCLTFFYSVHPDIFLWVKKTTIYPAFSLPLGVLCSELLEHNQQNCFLEVGKKMYISKTNFIVSNGKVPMEQISCHYFIFFFLREETELLNTKLNKNYKKLWLAERQEINLDSINTISFLKCV